ncbi:MAG: hypothetical protein MJZ16_12105, partial [Bacteroidales bacterium]|nr:hypothetical protein [Bacteroidales bacterium]
MKKFLKISGLTLGLIAVAIIACLIAVQTPRVQTYLAQKAVGMLESKFGGTIEFEKVQVHPFDALVLKNIVVKDNEPYKMDNMPAIDTIFRARYLVATFSVKGLFKKEGLHVKRAYLTDAVFNLTNEPEGTNIQRFLNLKKNEEQKEQGNVFDVGQIEVQNLRFRLISYSGMLKTQAKERQTGVVEPHVKGTINWDDLDVTLDLKGKGLTMSGGYMSGEVLSADIKEKSGYHVNNLKAKAKVGHGKTEIENVQLIDNWSVLNVPELTFNYDNSQSWGNFIEEVRMKGSIADSRVDIRSVSYFAPSLKGRSIIADVSEGKVEGYVNDLHIKKLAFSEQLSGVRGVLKGSLTGLPDSQGMLTNIPTIDLKFTTAGIGKFIKGWAPTATVDLSQFAKGETFSFVGAGDGPLNRMCIRGVLASKLGKVDADIDITNTIDPNRPIKITGYVETKDLNIGEFIGNDIVKECTLRTSMSATLTPGNPSAQLDSIVIDRLNVLGYDYSGIAAAGTYKDQSFDGRIICNDP